MKYLILSLFAIISTNSIAQTEEIDKICNDYDEKIAKAEEEEVPEMAPKIEVTCQLTKRAIGPVNHKINIYFKEYEVEIGQPGQDVFHKEAVIQKVEFNISSVSYNVTYSYYFDEGGILIKYVERSEGYDCLLKEVYFEEKEAIRIKQLALTGEACIGEEKAETFDHTDPSKDEKAQASWILDDANRFREILFANYELIKN